MKGEGLEEKEYKEWGVSKDDPDTLLIRFSLSSLRSGKAIPKPARGKPLLLFLSDGSPGYAFKHLGFGHFQDSYLAPRIDGPGNR